MSLNLNTTYNCGDLAYQLADSYYQPIVSVTEDGFIQVEEVTDIEYVGSHYIEFEVFLKDIDQ